MSENYTPNIARIESAYYQDRDPVSAQEYEDVAAEFARFVAHVKAEAWDEGVGYCSDHVEDLRWANPHRARMDGATMNIPEEAVEKAAEALHLWRGHVVPWDKMHEAAKDGWRAEARAALSAAAPLIAAQAWDEGFSDGLRQDGEGEDGPRYVNPYRMKERP